MSKLELYNIYAGYEESKPVLKDISFFVEKGEFIVLLGTSGCGKTTILNLIAGMIPISAGELYIDGVKSNDTPPRKRNIAMVFQNYALYPHMTVYDNMAFGLQIRKVDKKDIDQKVKSAAKILDIEHLLERKPKALSGGQRQRVAMGRAIVRNPKVFLMDEPLSNLDAKLRVQMRTEISKLSKKLDSTFIYVTHDQTEAMTLGTRIVVMKDGVVQQVATPKEIYNHPANQFVAGFIGSPQMNFMYGKIIERGGNVYLETLGKEIEMSSERTGLLKASNNIGKNVLVGIRPENIVCVNDDFKGESPVFKAQVEVSENLGAEVFLYTKIMDRNITIKRPEEDGLENKESVSFVMNIEKLHVFNEEDQVTIF